MASEVRIGINGFGRIGRCVMRAAAKRGDVRVAGINDLAGVDELAYLLKYDSVHGWTPTPISNDASSITAGKERIPFFSSQDPAEIPWGKLGADVIIESSGAMRTRAQAAGHLRAGAKRVLISAPSDDADATLVVGVNDGTYEPERHHVISMASCTTNSLAPVAKVLHERFGVERLMITTVHAYTSSQSLMDTPVRKRRRGRAAALSIVPTTTGAARATAKVIPALAGRMDGMALRVPIPDGSVTDIVANLGRAVSADEVNRALMEAAAAAPLAGILRVSSEEIVSRDIIGDPHSAIVDAPSTMVLGERMVKLLVWYDNEWGYASRLCDLARILGARG
ncbi:MAG: type I glyceraldehyde-3-phosphate dehydrogenase [Planctomycetes bacterium]|nr:type I glyceraldehyde-3-phosphate dehydrogenase [Planctomycetota bacterium]